MLSRGEARVADVLRWARAAGLTTVELPAGAEWRDLAWLVAEGAGA